MKRFVEKHLEVLLVVSLGLLIFFAAVGSISANAQEACSGGGDANGACLSWGAVTTDTSGNTLTGPVTYRTYVGKDGLAKTVLFDNLTALSAKHSGLTPGVYCYQVTALHAGLESDRSNEACKTILFSKPAAPALSVD